MTVRLLGLSLDVADPAAAAAFWGGLLARPVERDGDALRLPGDERQVGLRFVPAERTPALPHLVHLHVTSDHVGDQDAVIRRALDLGARLRDPAARVTGEDHVVLVDPVSAELCVIEPTNGYLAGCGPLGELAGDGSRAVGLFWSAVLGWPLVWDQDDETVVQSPYGGTKVAWGGGPELPRSGRSPQRMDLVADDVDAEVARLVGLGAAVVGRDGDLVELTDPDGTTFTLAAG
ncbi:VOC family protein [Lapillicoccus jejuensis]|uniref:Putative enzyme related to lactoylglutathione lyase n=1 Tax=Lapillicoccus jejuensis TaxID=402171 RepID=A0A542DZF4_9MICO|nr:VOC family protein [Lapillicoccus jejuensis]TQJ08472.1 putative enzyme related to lactoylglutathione lyase [Lapillicoccus jejuensis]